MIEDRARSREQVVCPPILQQGAYLIESHFYTHTNQFFLLPQAIFDAKEGAPLLGVDHTINMEVGV